MCKRCHHAVVQEASLVQWEFYKYRDLLLTLRLIYAVWIFLLRVSWAPRPTISLCIVQLFGEYFKYHDKMLFFACSLVKADQIVRISEARYESCHSSPRSISSSVFWFFWMLSRRSTYFFSVGLKTVVPDSMNDLALGFFLSFFRFSHFYTPPQRCESLAKSSFQLSSCSCFCIFLTPRCVMIRHAHGEYLISSGSLLQCVWSTNH